EPSPEISLSQRRFDIEEDNNSGINYVRGYSPISDAKGTFVGGVLVEISAGRQSILKGDVANLLKNYASGRSESHYRKLIVSEYYQGKLISTTGESIPLERPLSSEVQSRPGSTHWLEEVIEG